jgi:hypothetical protein
MRSRIEERMPDFTELERKLYAQLGTPVQRGGTTDAETEELLAAIRELRCEVSELRKEAAGLGGIPGGHSWPVVAIMKSLSILLSWYTRRLVRFGNRCVNVADASLAVLELIAKKRQQVNGE